MTVSSGPEARRSSLRFCARQGKLAEGVFASRGELGAAELFPIEAEYLATAAAGTTFSHEIQIRFRHGAEFHPRQAVETDESSALRHQVVVEAADLILVCGASDESVAAAGTGAHATVRYVDKAKRNGAGLVRNRNVRNRGADPVGCDLLFGHFLSS